MPTPVNYNNIENHKVLATYEIYIPVTTRDIELTRATDETLNFSPNDCQEWVDFSDAFAALEKADPETYRKVMAFWRSECVLVIADAGGDL